MTSYIEDLRALCELSVRLDAELATEGAAAERDRTRAGARLDASEAAAGAAGERLHSALERARSAGVAVPAAGRGRAGKLGSDPVADLQQFVYRIDEAVDKILHTKQTLSIERERIAADRRAAEADERARAEQLKREREAALAKARRGDRTLGLALGAIAVAGMVAGLVGAVAAAIALPLVAGACAYALAAAISSTLAARVIGRAPQLRSEQPDEPGRSRAAEALFALTGAGACSAACALGSVLAGSTPSALAAGALLVVLIAGGVVVGRAARHATADMDGKE